MMLELPVVTTYHEMLAVSLSLRGTFIDKLRTKQVSTTGGVMDHSAKVFSSEMDENMMHSGGRGESKHVRPLVSAATG